MAINLQKGQRIDLTKSGDRLQSLMVGLGWDEAPQGMFGGKPIDCDASVILCGADGKLVSSEIDEYCVYFNNLRHASGAVIHQGDNLTGGGDGDDEQIMVNLQKMPANVAKLVFVVNIYDAKPRNQHFGMIKNAFIRLVNQEKRTEICRFNLSEDYNGMTGLIMGEIYRKNGIWKFNAIGQPVKEASRLQSLINFYM